MLTTILERRILHDRWSTFSEATVRLPNGAVERRVIEDHGDAAAVLLYDPDRRTALLVRQPRVPVIDVGGTPLLEAVAGRMEGDSAEETARADALEEAGVAVRALTPIGTFWSMPAVSTERIHYFLAEYSAADRVGSGGGAADENECIEVVEVPLAELKADLAAGTLHDGKTVLLVQTLMLARPELFGAV